MLQDEMTVVSEENNRAKCPSFNHTHSRSHGERPPSQGQGELSDSGLSRHVSLTDVINAGDISAEFGKI